MSNRQHLPDRTTAGSRPSAARPKGKQSNATSRSRSEAPWARSRPRHQEPIPRPSANDTSIPAAPSSSYATALLQRPLSVQSGGSSKPAQQPAAILRRPDEQQQEVKTADASKRKSPAAAAKASNNHSSKTKKKKKPKPSGGMSLGDVMTVNYASREAQSRTAHGSQNLKKAPSVSRKTNSRSDDFPALPSAAFKQPPVVVSSATVAAPAKKKVPTESRPRRNSSLPTPAVDTIRSNVVDDRLMGDEHALIRFMNSGVKASTQKGKQRFKVRKKQLTSLKKKVLKERLRKWRESHPKEGSSGESDKNESRSVCLLNFVQPDDDLEDDDEHQEIVSNLKELALRIGPISDAFVPRSSSSRLAFVRFVQSTDALAAQGCWNNMVIGGSELQAIVPPCDVVDKDSEAWKQAMMSVDWTNLPQSSELANGPSDVTSHVTSSMVLENVLTVEDVEDADCMQESLRDLTALARKFGDVSEVTTEKDGESAVVRVTYIGSTAEKATNGFNDMVIGGVKVKARVDGTVTAATTTTSTVVLENALTDDDRQDQECLDESLEDIMTIARQFGSVADIRVKWKDSKEGLVFLAYSDSADAAKRAIDHFDGLVLGGQELSARHENSNSTKTLPRPSTVLLRNLLTDEDLEDEDCLEESKADLMKLVEKYGPVRTLKVDMLERGLVRVEYDGNRDVAVNARSELDGTVIGGQIISATLEEGRTSDEGAVDMVDKDSKETPKEPTPIYSGDKLIPEQYAECKRVPKIPNTTSPRRYAVTSTDPDAKNLLIEMLGELMRLQQRAAAESQQRKSKARRRLVMGLREVARGIRAHKIKMVAMANNLDQYGVIDEKLQEILNLARDNEVPILFELSKKGLGKALGKTIKMSVIGIQNADGAHEQFKKLKQLAPAVD